jgi:tetratricopeptide (TPR) repeat protein
MKTLFAFLMVGLLWAAGAQAQTTAKEWCEKANKTTDNDLKIEYANNALELDPKSEWAYHLRGFAKAGKGNYQEAIEDYNKAIELFPTYSSAYNNRGIARYNLKQYTSALADLDKAIEHDAKNAYAYLNKGRALVKLNRKIEALEWFRKGEELDKTLTFHLSQKKLAQAEEWCSKAAKLSDNALILEYTNNALELDPNSHWAYLLRGYSKYGSGSYQSSIEDYTKAIELLPTYSMAYNNRGIARYYLKQYTSALADLDKAIEYDAKNTNAHLNKGRALVKLDRKVEALEWFRKGEELDKTLTFHLSEKKLAQAEEWCSKAAKQSDDALILEYANNALELDPNSHWAYHLRGYSKYGSGSYQSSIEDYTKAIELLPTYSNAYSNRGTSKYALGQYNAALPDFDKAIEQNAKNAYAHLNKGRALVKLGRYSEALECFQKSEKQLAQQGGSPSSYITLSKRYALVISNSAYQYTKSLGGQPATDARTLKRTLEALGFIVMEISEKAQKADMEFAIIDFVRKAANADVVVAYYAGHGIEVKGVNYLLPLGARLREPDHAEIEAVRLNFLVTQLNRCKAKINLVLLDACRDDPFANRPASERTTDEYRGFRTIESTPGSMLVMYAAEPGHRALNTGVFAEAVEQNLKTGVEIMDFVRDLTLTVYDKTNENQKPTIFGAILHKFKF